MLLGGLMASSAGCERAPTRPNLLFVSIDTLRADHCSLYGYPRPTTPRLDRLAGDGVVFENAYAPMATTAPSHATMFTGLLPRRHGVLKNGHVLGPRHRTLAETLAREGYSAHAVVSSFVLDRRFGVLQGFGSYDDEFSGQASQHPADGDEAGGSSAFNQPADRATEKALRWLAAAGYLGRERPAAPFFLWLHLFDPHAPYAPPDVFRRPFAPADEGDAHAAMLASYDGEIRFADASLGELLDGLARAGILDDTLVVATADHGEGLMTHGHQDHGIHLYEEAVRVPLLFRWRRGLPRAARLRPPVSLADIAPTVLELIGVPDRAVRSDGESLAPLIRGEQPGDPRRAIFLERRHYDAERVGGFEVRGSKTGVRIGAHKYIEAPEESSYELFDLAADPGEQHNLVRARPREAAALERVLAEWRRRPGAGRTRSDDAPETLEALRALGYVQ